MNLLIILEKTWINIYSGENVSLSKDGYTIKSSLWTSASDRKRVIYGFDGSSWNQIGQDINGNNAFGGWFGFSLSGDFISLLETC